MSIFQNMSPDDWENFAAYYLENIGYSIIEDASVGPDGGKDLIAEKYTVRCLVSCKNYVRSNRSVTLAEENSIPDRMAQHTAKLFIGFYSTKAGNNLKNYLRSSNIPHLLLEGVEISENLANLPFMINQSFFDSGTITQPKIFGAEYVPLLCCCGCGDDLLNSDKIDHASCFLFAFNGNLKLEWYLDDHINNLKPIKQFSISNFLHLKELNEIINEIESVINDPRYNVVAEFDIALIKMVESSYQMVYPSNWHVG